MTLQKRRWKSTASKVLCGAFGRAILQSILLHLGYHRLFPLPRPCWGRRGVGVGPSTRLQNKEDTRRQRAVARGRGRGVLSNGNWGSVARGEGGGCCRMGKGGRRRVLSEAW